MRRRTLDIMFSTGGLVLAILLLIMGFVFTSNANFARDYVKTQLGQEQLTFKTVDKLTPAEKSWTAARTNCLVTFAGQQVTTGRQAECWANEYIGGHLKDPNKIVGANGLNYSQLGTLLTTMKAQITTAEANKDPGLAALQQKYADVSAARDTVFKGEMLRNALLTSYGFSVLGDKARLGADVTFIVSGVLFLLAAAGFVHAFRTPRSAPFAPVPDSGRTPVTV